jgi:leucyl aminopeptidase
MVKVQERISFKVAIKVVLSSGVEAMQVPAEVLAIPVMAGAPADPVLSQVDPAAAAFVASGEHAGRIHEIMLLPGGAGSAAPRTLLYGLGAAADLDGSRLRFAHQEMVRTAREYGFGRIAVLMAGALSPADFGPVIEGCVAGSWDRRARSTGRHPATLTELVLVGFGDPPHADVAVSRRLGEATARAREWQNMPANELGPGGLEAVARELSGRLGLDCEILGAKALSASGYNLLAAVGGASDDEPRLIKLQYRAGTAGGPNLALVGKGITFDSGGLSMKDADAMVKMRGDMGGAAAVLAAIEVIAESRLAIDVMAVIAAAENLPGRGAQRPGDVWTSASGKTVEVLNTDAEGRLILADALALAGLEKPDVMIDVATLTGACRVALGSLFAAVMGNDQRLVDTLLAAGRAAGEPLWQLPLVPEYREDLKSPIADLKNVGGDSAGAITAGLFLEEFVGGTRWAHLDIAGPAFTEKDLPHAPRGATGFGVRLLVRCLQRLADEGAGLAGR